jgi:hypothetical protein
MALSAVTRPDRFDTGSYRGPAADARAVTPADNTALPQGIAKRLYVGGAGDVTVVTLAGTVATYKAVPVGTYLRVFVQGVQATGTTATNIVAEY